MLKGVLTLNTVAMITSGKGDEVSSQNRSQPAGRPIDSRRFLKVNFALREEMGKVCGFSGIFGVVRRAVREVLGIERTGLGLALSDLPSGVGAYWPVTGNVIVLNEGLLSTMNAMARSTTEYNSFVYVILAHEYLHSLGYWGEGPVRQVTAQVTRAVFGPDHPATTMAEGDLWELYPFLRFAHGGNGQRLRMVSDFDTDTTSAYIR
jgi:hypothetical protein